MLVFGNSRVSTTPGPYLSIDCAACGREDTRASSSETEERIALFYIVPLPVQRERHVVCSECGADRLSRLPLDELTGLSPEAAGRHLFERVSLVTRVVAVAGLILFGCPSIGLALGAAAMVMSRKSRGWPYRVGLATVVLNVLFVGGLLLRSALIEWKVI